MVDTTSAPYEYAARLLGGRVAIRTGAISVGTDRVVIVPANPERVALLLINLGAAQVRIGYDETLTTMGGLPLPANGGNYRTLMVEDFVLQTNPHYGISTAAGNTVLYIEVVRVKRDTGA